MQQQKIALEFKNVEEVMDYAVKSEENAHSFYMSWSKKLKDRSLVKVFEDLAAEELKHKEFLLGVKKGGVLKPSEEEITDLKISDYVMDVKASTDLDYQEALTLAMQREKEAFKLYTGLAAMAKDEDMKNTFKVLAQEEAKHKLRLEVMYDEEILKEN
ncbi:MAG: ferritin family protein [Candidatus Aminicenantes bacterium]|nr:MAG: ferritin family protein [Candidatus Aminicenantes bacterium]